MRIETIERKIYTFDELSQEVKDKICSNWEWDDNDSSMLKELFEEDLNSHYGFPDSQVVWSLGCCQGDGVSFTGRWYGDELLNIVNKAFDGAVPKNVKRILPFIDSIELRRINNHYTHGHTVSVYFEDVFSNWKNYPARVERTLDDLMQTIDAYRLHVCDELEKFGYAEIEYKQSEEYVKEMCEANEYEFTEEGKII